MVRTYLWLRSLAQQGFAADAVHSSEKVSFMAFRENQRWLGPSLLIILAAAILLSGCNIGCWFVPCDRTQQMRAIVRDSSGSPLPKAHLAIQGYSAETDRNGCLMLPVHDSNLDLRADDAGYKPFHKAMSAGVNSIDITLQPSNSAQESTAVQRTIPESALTCKERGPRTADASRT
jgi:hypothetical protein